MESVKNFKNETLLFLLVILGIVTNAAPNYINIDVSISDRILFITFLALLWYAWETGEMKKEMVKQTELEQKPIIDLFYRLKTNEHEEYLRLRNSGKGVAYNIQVKPIIIEDRKFKFYFNDPNLILTPLGKEQTLHVDAYDRNKHLGEGQLDFFKNTISPQTIYSKDDLREANFMISYKNANKKKYQRIFKFYCATQATDNFKVKFIEEKIS